MAYQRKISVRCMDWVSWHHFTRDYTQNTSISPRFIASCWKSSHEPNIVWVNTCPSSSNTGPVEPTCTKESWTMDLQLTSQKMCFRSVNSRSEQFIITIRTIVDQIICPKNSISSTHLKLSTTICTTIELLPHPRQT